MLHWVVYVEDVLSCWCLRHVHDLLVRNIDHGGLWAEQFLDLRQGLRSTFQEFARIDQTLFLVCCEVPVLFLVLRRPEMCIAELEFMDTQGINQEALQGCRGLCAQRTFLCSKLTGEDFLRHQVVPR